MYTAQSKKLLIINILNILKKHTDADNPLSQKQILDLLESEYDMKVDRKSIKRNLVDLQQAGFDIECRENLRTNKSGEEETLSTGWYLNHDFEDAELRLVIDSILFSKNIPYRQCKKLIEKLEGLSNKHFIAKTKHICNIPIDMPENKQLFVNIEVLDEAISKNRQVEFTYNDFGTDKKLHPRCDYEGNPRRYLINPYQMVATNSRYYVICNYDKYDDESNYRIDRITNIKLLDTKRKPISQVKGLEEGLQMPKHLAEHIYMFDGPSETCKLLTDKSMVTEFIDWFGKDVNFVEGKDGAITVTVKANLAAMRHWVHQHAPKVKVLSPEKLVEGIKKDLAATMALYE